MKRFMNNTTVLVLSALAVIVITCVGLNVHLSNKQRVLREFNEHHLRDAKLVARVLSVYVESMEDNLEMLSRLLSMQGASDAGIRATIERFREQTHGKEVGGIVLLSQEMVLQYASDSLLASIDWKHIRAPADDTVMSNGKWLLIPTVVSSVALATVGGQQLKQIFLLSTTIRDKENNGSLGVLAFAVDIERVMREKLWEVDSTDQHDIWAINEDGTLLFQSRNKEMEFHNVHDESNGCRSCHQSLEYVTTILRQKEGVITYTGTMRQEKLAAFSSLLVGGRRWLVGVSVPYAIATGFADDNLTKTIVMLLLVGASIGVGVWIYQRQVRQTLTMTAEAQFWKEKHDLEEVIRISEERYRAIVEHSLTGIYIVQDEILRFVNRRFCELLGYRLEGMPGQVNLLDIAHPEDRSFVRAHLKRATKSEGYHSEAEFRLVKASGEKVAVRVVGSSCEYEGKPAVIGMILDIQKEKTLEDQLIQAQKMEALGRLAGGIAHDFNNVLTIIAAALSALRSMKVPSTYQQYVLMASNAVRRGSEVAKRLLTFARTDNVEMVPISLSHIVDEVVQVLEHTILKSIRIVKNVHVENGMILGNESQCEQILLNLCVNACDAMPNGGVLSITITNADVDTIRKEMPDRGFTSYVVVHVRDSGVGMDAQTREKIFQPFFTTKESGKGTGLGLSIVHSLMVAHKGFVRVESKRGRGSTFSVFFPALPITAKATMTTPASTANRGNETILLVEDEAPLRKMLKESLVSQGYTVIEAVDGQDGLIKYAALKKSIDLVVLDLGLPRLSGNQLLAELRRLNDAGRVVVATGYLDSSIKESLSLTGVLAFIQKPYDLDEISQTIRSVLNTTSRKEETVELSGPESTIA